MSIVVNSEFGSLRAVLMHTPGSENKYVAPSQREYYLIDDILHVPTAFAEVSAYQSLIECFGATVYRFQDMLASILKKDKVRRRLLRLFDGVFIVNDAHKRIIMEASENDLASHMVNGNSFSGIQLPPLPNLAFQRDLGMVIGNYLVICSMKEKARKREEQLFKFLVEEHPCFRNVEIMHVSGELEGGDVLVVRDDLIVIGYGHRTKFPTILELSKKLLSRTVNSIITVALPDNRQYMHLDTVFTILNDDQCVVYSPAILGSQRLGLRKADISVITRCGDDLRISNTNETLLGCLNKHGLKYEPIFVGGDKGDSICADQEQWWDGANTFAIAPSKIVIYDRNEQTIRSLERAGFKVYHIQSKEDIKNISFEEDGMIVFAIASSEICKARGGPHCLTMPLWRKDI